MAYLTIDPARTAYGSLWYVLDAPGHNGHEERNVCVSYVAMDKNRNPRYQMQEVWERKGSRVHRLMYSVIQSFSRKELDPDNPADWQKANLIGQETAMAIGKGRQAVVATQIDGKSGLIHNHILINNVHPLTHLGFDGQEIEMLFNPDGTPMIAKSGKRKGKQRYRVIKESETNQDMCRALSDSIVSKYVELDHGGEDTKAFSHAELGLREKNQNLKDKHYIWKDDLRGRIDKVVEKSSSWKEVVQNLKKDHVKVRDGKYQTYTLLDEKAYKKEERRKFKEKRMKEGVSSANADMEADEMDFTPKHKLSSRNGKLGGAYSKESIEKRIAERQAQEEKKKADAEAKASGDAERKQMQAAAAEMNAAANRYMEEDAQQAVSKAEEKVEELKKDPDAFEVKEKPEIPAVQVNPVPVSYVTVETSSALVEGPLKAKDDRQFYRVQVPFAGRHFGTMTMGDNVVEPVEGTDKVLLKFREGRKRNVLMYDREGKIEGKKTYSPEYLKEVYAGYDRRLERRHKQSEAVSADVKTKQEQNGMQYGDN